MSAAKPRWPAPVIFAKKFLVSRHQADCLICDLLGVPRPERPAVDELITATELAEKLKCSPDTVVRQLRQARQAAAAESADEAPDRAA
jgi:hypothetical protein